jgi:hypothetical protein
MRLPFKFSFNLRQIMRNETEDALRGQFYVIQ